MQLKFGAAFLGKICRVAANLLNRRFGTSEVGDLTVTGASQDPTTLYARMSDGDRRGG